MAKRSFRGKPKRRPSGPRGGGNVMAQAQKMQQAMATAQEALADETVTVTAGGGVISIKITGRQRVEAITLDPELLDSEDVDMLQDLLVAAVNQAIEQSQAMAAERMEGITGGLGGLGGGLDSLLGGLG